MEALPPDAEIVPYRGMLHAQGCTLSGRVLRRPYKGWPRSDDGWWRNLRNSWRRFDSEPLAGARVDVAFRGEKGHATTDAEGYWSVTLPVPESPSVGLWEMAEARRGEAGKVYLQPVQCVPRTAAFGLISDIDDTVLESNVTRWQTAAQLAFLHNARTRKPLQGVAGLYQALQAGHDGRGPNPVFYVSGSPWNLYDLLEDFLELNEIPQGPMLLRDVDFDRTSWRHDTQAKSKLEHMELLLARYPGLKWLLVGDSGQVDAKLYAELVLRNPQRFHAVYIRDIDPGSDSGYDRFVDSHIQRIAGTGVPMLRAKDSNAMAAHARELGLIAPEQVPEVARDVQHDKHRPEQKDVVKAGALKAAAGELPAGG